MKTVKEWYKDGYNVKIYAKFIKKGYDPYFFSAFDEYRDVVELEATIYDKLGIPVVNYDARAYEGKYVEIIKSRRFRKNITRDCTIAEVYDESLEKLIERCNDDIDDRNYNQKITDGLPDSLLDLA